MSLLLLLLLQQQQRMHLRRPVVLSTRVRPAKKSLICAGASYLATHW